MNAIALQSTPTLRKRRMAIAIADFYFKCDRPSSFAKPLLICNIYKHFKSAIGPLVFLPPIDMQHLQTLQTQTLQMSDRMTNLLPNHLHIQSQLEICHLVIPDLFSRCPFPVSLSETRSLIQSV